MIANVVNAVIGLALVYVAIITPHLLEGHVVRNLVVAVVIFVLALLARRSDFHPWQSSTNLALALGLFALGLLQGMPYPLLTFWGLFWVGLLVAVLSLWGALYHPSTDSQRD
jgi:hypothetical protein